jgi:hypothetical protein
MTYSRCPETAPEAPLCFVQAAGKRTSCWTSTSPQLTVSYCKSLCWNSSAPVAWLDGCRPSTVRAYASFIQNFTLFLFRSVTHTPEAVHLPSSPVHICLSGLQIDCIRTADVAFLLLSLSLIFLLATSLIWSCELYCWNAKSLDYSWKLV